MNVNFEVPVILISFLIVSGCGTVNNDNNFIDIEKLTQEWVHSREEEKDSIKIFRPKGYKYFPTSRYRQEYKYKENGECSFLVLAPNDGHYFEGGYWFYENKNRLLTIIDTTQKAVITFEIKELTINLLRLDVVESHRH